MARDLRQCSSRTAVGIGVALAVGKEPLILVVCPSSHLSWEASADFGRSQACHLAVINLSKVFDDGYRHAKFRRDKPSRGSGPTKWATEHTVDWKIGHDHPEPSCL